MDTPLSSKSIWELSCLIRNKNIQVIELVREALQTTEYRNDELNAFITINPEAEDVARQMDQQIASGKDMGPLYGIPIGVKDMIDTDNMKTTMGSKIYENFVPSEGAEVVKRLKKAGAVIIGKTNTHSFAYGPTGDRSYYGPMRNPYDKTKMAGGSSGGSAVAVAAGLCNGALGTDTSGSIRIPSSFCGLVGMKPTNGSIPTSGVHPLAESLDCVGPMTRTVEDNALMMDVLTNRNPLVVNTASIGKGVSNLSVGIPDSFFFDDVNQEIAVNVHTMIERLRQMGIRTYDIYIPDVDAIWSAQKTVIAYEAYQLHKENVVNFPNDWDMEVKERLENTAITEEAYHKALKIQQESKQIFKTAMNNVDALLTPTSPILTPDVNQRVLNHVNADGLTVETEVRSMITRLTAPINLIGLPCLTLPSGFSSSGLPLGVQLIGKENEENILYQIGYALQSDF